MRTRFPCYLAWVLLASLLPGVAGAQFVTIPLSPDEWTATDTIRFESYLGRPSLYINSGVAIAKSAAMEDGTIEYDLAVTPTSSFVGMSFRAQSPRFSEVIFFRPRSSGTSEAVQYGPAFNNVGTAWQVYHGPGANAVAVFPRERWMHVKLELAGPTARMYLDTATTPTLTVPRLAGTGGHGLGVWTGAFGRGAYFSNIRYAASASSTNQGAVAAPTVPAGTIMSWELSDAVPAADFTPTRLPDLTRLKWQPVSAEQAGFVLVNRYRAAPNGGLPADPKTQEVIEDSVMTGRVAGSQIVYARTTVTAAQDGLRRLRYTYSDGVVIYANGQPLVFDMNPQNLRDGLGVMDQVGDAVYLPLKRGRNEIVFAVMEVGGGWAFSGRLDPP